MRAASAVTAVNVVRAKKLFYCFFITRQTSTALSRAKESHSDKMKLIILALCIVQSLSFDEKLLPKYLDYEQSFISDLEEYIEIQESVLQLLRKKLLNFQVEHASAAENPAKYFDSEINKFLLLKRLTVDTKLMVEKSVQVAEQFQQDFNSISSVSDFPTQKQLSSAARAIINLQKRDRVKAERLASGIFKKVKSR